jgi:hypothetical protein
MIVVRGDTQKLTVDSLKTRYFEQISKGDITRQKVEGFKK